MDSDEPADHWNGRYRDIGAESVSWYEPTPHLSLAMLQLAGLDPCGPGPAAGGPPRSLIDVGGGASSLARTLVDRGTADVTVLDLSTEALSIAQSAMTDPSVVDWIADDITTWEPRRAWDVWHDRAVFHFLTDPERRKAYRARLDRALAPGGTVCIATFAEDGPEQCSGLDVVRYAPEALLLELGPGLQPIASGRYLHLTPSGGVQPFSWVVASRR